MTKDDIIKLPNGHLRQRSKKIGVVTDKVRQLVDDMEAATLDWEDSRPHEVGVALAAVQIDHLYRVVVVRNDLENKQDRSFSAFINPEITKLEGEVIEDFEGCLSVSDIYGRVPRYSRAKIKYIDINGQPRRLTVEGFLARTFQHEIDHTNGILFIDRIKDAPEAFFRLTDDGKLEKVDYAQTVADNPVLW